MLWEASLHIKLFLYFRRRPGSPPQLPTSRPRPGMLEMLELEGLQETILSTSAVTAGDTVAWKEESCRGLGASTRLRPRAAPHLNRPRGVKVRIEAGGWCEKEAADTVRRKTEGGGGDYISEGQPEMARPRPLTSRTSGRIQALLSMVP